MTTDKNNSPVTAPMWWDGGDRAITAREKATIEEHGPSCYAIPLLPAQAVNPEDPWRGLYLPARMPAPSEYGDLLHPDIPSWPDDREDALDKLVHAQGFDFQIVAGEFTEAAMDDGDELYWQEMLAWNPEAPEGDWRLAWKGDTEDGPYAWFVRPMALRSDPAASAAIQPGAPAPAGYWFTDDPAKFAMPGSGFHPGAVPPEDAIDVVPVYAAPPGQGIDGYQRAFYEVGEMLGLTAQARSPKEVWEIHMRPALQALTAPDATLLRFYQVTDYPSLAAALESHVLKLIDTCVRNVKPWEDTFPPTLLPKWQREQAAQDTDWRVEASRWLAEKADAQDATNAEYPRHANAYPSWRERALAYRDLSREVLIDQRGAAPGVGS